MKHVSIENTAHCEPSVNISFVIETFPNSIFSWYDLKYFKLYLLLDLASNITLYLIKSGIDFEAFMKVFFLWISA